MPKKRSLIDVYTDSAPHEQDAFTAALIGTMKRHGNEQQLRLLARALEDYRTPKETPVTKHPETTTEWLEDIALELHAITGLLNERLPLRERDFQTKRADDLEGLLQAARADRDTWEAAYKRADDLLSRTRDERDEAVKRHAALRNDVAACRNACQIEDILARDDERCAKGEPECDCGAADGYHGTDCPRAVVKPQAERDEWKGKFEQVDNLLTRDDERGQS